MKKKLEPFFENITESGTACLLTMVQGNILLLGLTHWITAAQTGLLAGTAAATAITLAKTESRLIIAIMLGVITAVVDYFIHPGQIGHAPFIEALITGLGAGVLSFIAGSLVASIRERRIVRQESEVSQEQDS